MSPLETYLQSVEARANAATEGPWRMEDKWEQTQRHIVSDGQMVANTLHKNDDANATFIAHSRTDIPKLCRMVRGAVSALRAQQARFELEQFEPGAGAMRTALEKLSTLSTQ